MSALIKEVVVLSFTNLKRDPRISRQLRALKDHYRLIACGTADPEIDGVRFVKLQPIKNNSFIEKVKNLTLLSLRNYEPYYWGLSHIRYAARTLSGMTADLVIANDIDTLPLAVKVLGAKGILLDAHEYAPLEFADSLVWRCFFGPYWTYLCKAYIPRADAMITVSQGIADEYRRCFNKQAGVVTNAAEYHEIEPRKTNGSHIRMIYHGAAIDSRRIEVLIDAMGLVDNRFELHLMLVPGSVKYIEALKNRANGRNNIKFPGPVPMAAIVPTLASYDIGLNFIDSNNFNHTHALPNKFFEFIQARLALVGGPSPEMAKIVRTHGCGVVADSFTAAAIASALTDMSSEQIDNCKNASNRLARLMSAEENGKIMRGLVQDLIDVKASGN